MRHTALSLTHTLDTSLLTAITNEILFLIALHMQINIQKGKVFIVFSLRVLFRLVSASVVEMETRSIPHRCRRINIYTINNDSVHIEYKPNVL